MTVEAIHFDCLACRAEADQLRASIAVLIILRVLEETPLDQVVSDLCFHHRRLFSPSDSESG